MIESSDSDGGSVAVSTYLALILDVISDPDMVNVSLGYLFASETGTDDVSIASRRATFMAGERLNASLDPILFSLKDMIFDNLQSDSSGTRVATLRLVESLLRKHWPYVMDILIRAGPPPTTRNPTIGHHRKEMQTLASLLDRECDVTSTSAYENYLLDAQATIEAQSQSLDQLFLIDASSVSISTESEGRRNKLGPYGKRHTINSEDRLIKEILHSLSSFFTNEVELNLILTKIVVDLASCPERSLEGWLLFSRADAWIGLPGSIAPDYSVNERDQVDAENHVDYGSEIAESSDVADDESIDFGTESTPQAARSKVLPSWSRFPPFLTLFKSLATQIRQYKSEIDSLENDLAERRQALHSCDDERHISAALAVVQEPLISPTKPPTYDRSPSFLFRRSPSKMGNVSPESPQKSTPESPFSAHFTSTKRNVTTLHSIRLHDDRSSDADPGYTTPTKSKRDKASLLDANMTPQRPMPTASMPKDDGDGPRAMCLSKLINNIIIFEEFIQEIMATVQVRRSLCDNCEFV